MDSILFTTYVLQQRFAITILNICYNVPDNNRSVRVVPAQLFVQHLLHEAQTTQKRISIQHYLKSIHRQLGMLADMSKVC